MPTRRLPRRPARHLRPLLGWRGRLILAAILIVTGIFASAFLARRLQPLQNTTAHHFDAILVLGTPADSDGNPTPTQLDRVTEAVREYQRGVAPRILLTGGPAHNRFVEAQVMARVAQALGIPPGVLLISLAPRTPSRTPATLPPSSPKPVSTLPRSSAAHPTSPAPP